MGIYRFEDIKIVHLEITTKCNASCPMCSRNISGGKLNPNLVLSELNLTDIKQIFKGNFLRQLKRIYLCGNYGDPILAKDLIESLQYFKTENPNLQIGIHTNGGLRDETFWTKLASLVTYCRFGIDGLEDTNHLYRQGVKWSHLTKNVKAFIDSGGRAEWDFLIFKHNEHQVEEARQLSEKWGFKSFQVKSTARFFSTHRKKMRPFVDVLDKEGNVTHQISPTTVSRFENKYYLENLAVAEKFGSLEDYWNKCTISCKVAAEKSIYISASGNAFPCCWTGIEEFNAQVNLDENHIRKIMNDIGAEAINSKITDIKSIVEGVFFSQIANSWSIDSIKDGRIKSCARNCGSALDPFQEQFI